MTKARVLVLISGGGSNLQTLIDASRTAESFYDIVHVISNRIIQSLRDIKVITCRHHVLHVNELDERGNLHSLFLLVCAITLQGSLRRLVKTGHENVAKLSVLCSIFKDPEDDSLSASKPSNQNDYNLTWLNAVEVRKGKKAQ
jgi:hypothetical protein